jgi:hypothetical protein
MEMKREETETVDGMEKRVGCMQRVQIFFEKKKVREMEVAMNL